MLTRSVVLGAAGGGATLALHAISAVVFVAALFLLVKATHTLLADARRDPRLRRGSAASDQRMAARVTIGMAVVGIIGSIALYIETGEIRELLAPADAPQVALLDEDEANAPRESAPSLTPSVSKIDSASPVSTSTTAATSPPRVSSSTSASPTASSPRSTFASNLGTRASEAPPSTPPPPMTRSVATVPSALTPRPAPSGVADLPPTAVSFKPTAVARPQVGAELGMRLMALRAEDSKLSGAILVNDATLFSGHSWITRLLPYLGHADL